MSDVLNSILGVLKARVPATPEGGTPNPGIALAIPKLAETLVAKMPWLTADRLEAYLSAVSARFDNPAKVYQTNATIVSLVANAADPADAEKRFESEIARQSQATTNIAAASTGGLDWGAPPPTTDAAPASVSAAVAAAVVAPSAAEEPAPAAPPVIEVVAEVVASTNPADFVVSDDEPSPTVEAAPEVPESPLAGIDGTSDAIVSAEPVVEQPAAEKSTKPKGTRKPRQSNAHAQVPVSDPSKVLVALLQAVRDRDALLEARNAQIEVLTAELAEVKNRPAAAPQFALAEQDITLLQELGIDLAAHAQ